MIKIFRKIRQRMLSENRFSKYLMYSIGEIVLVVIGILIALQVNIYKGNRENEQLELNYLTAVVNDLDQDIYELNLLMYNDSLQFDAYTTVLKAFGDEEIRNSRDMVKAIGLSNTFHSFDGNSIVFEDMKSSGKITLIGSDDVRYGLLKYYTKSAKIIKNQNESINPQIQTLMREAFTTNVDLNSLIEGFMFEAQWSAEIDELDLSFFGQDVKSEAVRHFANRISMMKALAKTNHEANKELLYEAKIIKAKIIAYLEEKGVVSKNQLPNDIVMAIKNGQVDVLKKRITEESLNNCFYMEDESGNYLVHCITYNSLPSLQFFVEKGADLEHVCENKTPLMYAIKYGHLDLVKYLVEQGADIKASNHGKTPMYYAKTYRHPEIEEYLKSINAE